MASLALYRKYRPQVFEDVIGQDHIVRVLKSQIKNGTINHAYLFSGTRGVGKTTIAKIFAKAINCLSENNKPCLKCENCIELSKQSSMDIVEMDAASNNGVDDIRDLKQKIQFPPVNGKYKVYIIDEVHMLSTNAFNALLKTLEEPPSYAIFILATTESYKIPATILSRCTKFDFRLVSVEDLEKLVSKIYLQEGINATSEAITAIAKAGEGSARDTLSIADIVASFSENNVTYESFLECVGTLNSETIKDLCLSIKNREINKIISSLKEISESGKNLTMLVRDMLEFYRNVLVTKTIKDYKSFLKLPQDFIALYEEVSKKYNENDILVCMQKLSKLDTTLKYTINPRLMVESVFLDMSFAMVENKNISTVRMDNSSVNENSTLTEFDINEIVSKKIEEYLKNSSLVVENKKTTDNKESLHDKKIEEIKNSSSTNLVDTSQRTEKKLENLNKDIENLTKEINKTESQEKKDTFKLTDVNKIHSQFLYKIREAGLIFAMSALEYSKFKLEDNIYYLIGENSMICDTLKGFQKELQQVISTINSDLTLEIIENQEELEKQKKIEMLKNTFGKINIK